MDGRPTILPTLDTQTLGHPTFHYATIPSTQNELKRLLIQGAPNGTVVFTDRQTEGRGRNGREWISLKGDQICTSILLEPKLPRSLFPIINIVAGLTVAELLEENGLPAVQMKWPNDVMVDGRKVCGILSELVSKSARPIPYVVLGVGMNVSGHETDLPPELREIATTVQTHVPGVNRDTLLAQFLNRLEKRLHSLYAASDDEIGRIKSEFLKRWIYLTDEIHVAMGTENRSGIGIGIDSDGALILRTTEGKMVRVISGDVKKVSPTSSELHPIQAR